MSRRTKAFPEKDDLTKGEWVTTPDYDNFANSFSKLKCHVCEKTNCWTIERHMHGPDEDRIWFRCNCGVTALMHLFPRCSPEITDWYRT